jgi:hypothetical protein
MNLFTDIMNTDGKMSQATLNISLNKMLSKDFIK